MGAHEPVSYTHLDVYKRQEDKGPMPVNALKTVVGWGGGTFFKVGEQILPDA